MRKRNGGESGTKYLTKRLKKPFKSVIMGENRREGKSIISTSEKMNIILSRCGMTKKELAEKWGISQPSISQKFKENNWKESDLKKFCEITGNNYEIIFTDNKGKQI